MSAVNLFFAVKFSLLLHSGRMWPWPKLWTFATRRTIIPTCMYTQMHSLLTDLTPSFNSAFAVSFPDRHDTYAFWFFKFAPLYLPIFIWNKMHSIEQIILEFSMRYVVVTVVIRSLQIRRLVWEGSRLETESNKGLSQAIRCCHRRSIPRSSILFVCLFINGQSN